MGYCHLTRLYMSTYWRLGAHRRLHVSPGSSRYPDCHLTSRLWTTLEVRSHTLESSHPLTQVSGSLEPSARPPITLRAFPTSTTIGSCRSSAFISRSDSRLGPCHASPGMTPCLIMVERPPCALLATCRSLRCFLGLLRAHTAPMCVGHNTQAFTGPVRALYRLVQPRSLSLPWCVRGDERSAVRHSGSDFLTGFGRCVSGSPESTFTVAGSSFAAKLTLVVPARALENTC